ncbi:MAG: metalloregulator ArsR/SmtB family transcription factor [Thalassobaculaceae bacterium]|nr:metalloregulator ArsR/SmtB family transcription factor [Thalassobaculaceae bacterium]
MEDVLAGLRAIAEPTRLRILILCARSELSVTELVDILGQSQPRVSRHLKLMVEAGVLERNREGARAYYRMAERAAGSGVAHALTPLVPLTDATVETDLARLETIRVRRSERATAYFQENAEQWEDLRGLYVDDALVDASLMEAVRAEPVESLLDIGTGTGRVLEQLADHVTSAVGVDNAKPMLEIARDKLDRAGLNNCQVRLADMYHLPFPADRFDAVTLNMVLHYAEVPSEVLREATRVLKPGGRLILVDFAPHELEELRDQHTHRWLGFSSEEIGRLAKGVGLNLKPALSLTGDPLTVCLWNARKADSNDLTTGNIGAADLRAAS